MVVMLLMSGCRKDNGADVSEILRTIPNSASFVGVADLQKLITKTGSKIADGKIEASPELQAAIDKSKASSRQSIQAVLSGDSGIEPSIMVGFADGYNVFVTGIVSNSSKFEEFVSKQNGTAWKENDGIRTNGTIAMAENRFWIQTSGQSQIDPMVIKGYMALSEKQSFASSKFAGDLAEMDKDVKGWCDLNGVTNVMNMDFQTRAITKMALSSLFSDAGFAMITADFEKGSANIEARFLNDKGKDAKYLYSSEKISESTIGAIGGNADALMAIAVPNKLIEQLREKTSGQISMLGIVLQAFGSVDGTVAAGISKTGNVKGIIETTGSGTGDLMSLLRQYGLNTTNNGKQVFFSKGDLTMGEPVTTLGEQLKGASMGMVLTPEAMNNGMAGVKYVTLRVMPRGGSMVLDCTLTTADKKENALVTLLRQ